MKGKILGFKGGYDQTSVIFMLEGDKEARSYSFIFPWWCAETSLLKGGIVSNDLIAEAKKVIASCISSPRFSEEEIKNFYGISRKKRLFMPAISQVVETTWEDCILEDIKQLQAVQYTFKDSIFGQRLDWDGIVFVPKGTKDNLPTGELNPFMLVGIDFVVDKTTILPEEEHVRKYVISSKKDWVKMAQTYFRWKNNIFLEDWLRDNPF